MDEHVWVVGNRRSCCCVPFSTLRLLWAAVVWFAFVESSAPFFCCDVMCVRARARARACVCVCVCARVADDTTTTPTPTLQLEPH